MSTIIQVITRLENYTKELAATQAEDALAVSLDLKALIQFRIQSTGEDGDNAPFAPYSPQYAEYGRRKKGYQAGYFDMTRTGEYWRNVKPKLSAQSFGKVSVSIGPTSQDNINKAAGQVKKRGNILRPTQEEIRIIAESYVNYRLQRF